MTAKTTNTPKPATKGNVVPEHKATEGNDKPRPKEMPEHQETSGHKLGIIEPLAHIVGSLSVAGAAIFGVVEYMSANEDIRRERSLNIVKDWQQDKLIDRFSRVQKFVEQKLESSTIPPPDLPPEALAHAYQNLGYNWTLDLQKDADTQTLADLDRLTLYFSQIEICISAELCNAEVLHAYFNTEVTSFWGYFSGYAQFRREANYLAYGAPVDALVVRFERMERK